MNDKQLEGVLKKIYQELFKQATPKADFKKLHKSGETAKDRWFMKYYLPFDIQEEIIENIMNECKVTNKYDRERLRIEIHLGGSPNTSYKTWKKYCKIK